jgi:hypothetical protein
MKITGGEKLRARTEKGEGWPRKAKGDDEGRRGKTKSDERPWEAKGDGQRRLKPAAGPAKGLVGFN